MSSAGTTDAAGIQAALPSSSSLHPPNHQAFTKCSHDLLPNNGLGATGGHRGTKDGPPTMCAPSPPSAQGPEHEAERDAKQETEQGTERREESMPCPEGAALGKRKRTLAEARMFDSAMDEMEAFLAREGCPTTTHRDDPPVRRGAGPSHGHCAAARSGRHRASLGGISSAGRFDMIQMSVSRQESPAATVAASAAPCVRAAGEPCAGWAATDSTQSRAAVSHRSPVPTGAAAQALIAQAPLESLGTGTPVQGGGKPSSPRRAQHTSAQQRAHLATLAGSTEGISAPVATGALLSFERICLHRQKGLKREREELNRGMEAGGAQVALSQGGSQLSAMPSAFMPNMFQQDADRSASGAAEGPASGVGAAKAAIARKGSGSSQKGQAAVEKVERRGAQLKGSKGGRGNRRVGRPSMSGLAAVMRRSGMLQEGDALT
jgi:hypothetical protein